MFSSEILALGGKLHSHKVLSYISLKLPRVWANLLWRGEATLGAKIFPSKQAIICALLAPWGREKEYQSRWREVFLKQSSFTHSLTQQLPSSPSELSSFTANLLRPGVRDEPADYERWLLLLAIGHPVHISGGPMGHLSTFQNVISNLKQLAILNKRELSIVIFNLIRVVVISEAVP